jgi:hypothetical protein
MMAGTAAPAIAQTSVTVVTIRPDPGAEAQANADDANMRAALLAKQGGWNYKSGAIAHAQAAAARYQREADTLRAAPLTPGGPSLVTQPPVSPQTRPPELP